MSEPETANEFQSTLATTTGMIEIDLDRVKTLLSQSAEEMDPNYNQSLTFPTRRAKRQNLLASKPRHTLH